MAEFLTTSGTIHRMEQIISEAKKSLVFISPYVQISQTIHERLMDAGKRRVSITFVYGKCDLDFNEYENLKQIPGLQLFYFDNLHAKCYFNEEMLIITSMNLYEHSAKNREMGILLNKIADADLYEKAVREAESIVKNAELQFYGHIGNSGYNSGNGSPWQVQVLYNTTSGSCIRCATEIQQDTSKPLCRRCFDIWNRYGDTSYEENYCHNCGSEYGTSMAKPICYRCYKSQQH